MNTLEELNEMGINEMDIRIVQSQAASSRAMAITALIDNDNDIVEAIMSLTS